MLLQFVLVGLYGQNIDVSFEELTTKYENVGVSAAYSVGGKTEWVASQGFANEALKTPFTDTVLTRIASVTKPMTAICIMQLVEKGSLSLDDEIQKYIKEYPKKNKTAITVRHLLTHTSGIGGYKNFKEATSTVEYPTLEAVTKVFRDRKLKFEPGTNFSYTTYGYVLLGLVIEEVSGISYEEYLQKNILDVAGMKNTGIEKYGKTYENKSLLYHMKKGKVILPEPNNLSNRTPAGGLYSTVQDLIKFGNAVMNYELIKESTFQEMLEVGFPMEGNPYGLGWNLYGPKENYQAYIGHDGGQYGGNSQIIMVPKIKSTIVVLSNTSETLGSNIKLFAVDILRKIIKDSK